MYNTALRLLTVLDINSISIIHEYCEYKVIYYVFKCAGDYSDYCHDMIFFTDHLSNAFKYCNDHLQSPTGVCIMEVPLNTSIPDLKQVVMYVICKRKQFWVKFDMDMWSYKFEVPQINWKEFQSKKIMRSVYVEDCWIYPDHNWTTVKWLPLKQRREEEKDTEDKDDEEEENEDRDG